MLTALRANFGRISKAAEAVNITRQTHYHWYRHDEEYRNSVDNIKYETYEEFEDMVLEAVIKKLNEGNASVINRCFNTVFSKWAENMAKASPVKPKIITRIKYVSKQDSETKV